MHIQVALRQGWLLVLLAAMPLLLAPAAIAQPAPVRIAAPEAALLGKGNYTWFGLTLYEARLWADKKSFSASNWSGSSFALELIYARKLYGERIAVASIDEIKKLGIGTPAQHDSWLSSMKKIFPDVEGGTQLIGLYSPGQATRFFRDGTAVGEVADPEFGPAFFGIWLHPKTSAPKLRAALSGSK